MLRNLHLLLLLYNYIQTRKVYGKCTEHEMCVLMSSTMLVQNSLRSGKCSACAAQKATQAHLDINLEYLNLMERKLTGHFLNI